MAKRHGKKPSPTAEIQKAGPSLCAWLTWKSLQVLVLSAGLVYIVAPVFVHFNPWILNEILFLHRFSWPPFINLSDPQSLGLNNTRAFQIQSAPGVVLGAWHVLPVTEQNNDNVKYSEDDFVGKLQQKDSEIVLYLHGNLGTRAGRHRREIYKVLSSSGYHVVLMDYRGYGDSTSYPCEDGVVEDSLAAYKWIKTHNPDASIVIWGHSLGSAIAAKLVKGLGSNPKCLILEAPFNNLQDAVFGHPLAKPMRFLPWFHWAFVDTLDYEHLHFETDKNLLEVQVPVMILHAEDDGVVPYKLGKALFDTVREGNPKLDIEFVSFDGKYNYGHKHLWKAPELPEIIKKFVARVSKKGEGI